MKRVKYVHSPRYEDYYFHDEHPFNQIRPTVTLDLLKKINAVCDEDIVAPRMATDEELALVHDRDYIQAITRAGHGQLSNEQGQSYGVGTEDTPIFKNMHEACALLVGGTLTAVDLVMSGEAEHAVNFGGGLHHGFRGKASGFCIYNDCSVALKYINQKYGLRALYIDTDAHHGDGIQWSFYDDPSICTLSIHETGRYLFPGTGNVTERGQGDGYGYSFNVPLDAFTEDDSFLYAYRESMNAVMEFFRPDIILTQNGADAHYYDPLTHLSSTMKTYYEIPKLAHELAHKYCNGRWVAVGGGGYDIWRVVPRAWALVWLEMSEQMHLANKPIPTSWLEEWQEKSAHPLPLSFNDGPSIYEPIPRKAEIEEKNAQTVMKALYSIQKK